MSDLLSSDVLEQQFGPTGIEVLYQDASTRLICTRTTDGQVLEISRVEFLPGVQQFPDIHQAVLDGQSMGKVFRAHGVAFQRKVKTAYRQSLLSGFGSWFGSKGDASIVAVSILVGPDKTPYAEILEVYSPVVNWPQTNDHPLAAHADIIKLIDRFLVDRLISG